jgi:hypothetical protein
MSPPTYGEAGRLSFVISTTLEAAEERLGGSEELGRIDSDGRHDDAVGGEVLEQELPEHVRSELHSTDTK